MEQMQAEAPVTEAAAVDESGNCIVQQGTPGTTTGEGHDYLGPRAPSSHADPDPGGDEPASIAGPGRVSPIAPVSIQDPACTHQLIAVQDRLLQRLHSGAVDLRAFNQRSAAGYKDAAAEMARNTELLRTVKTDVLSIITRVAHLKRRLKAKFPREFEEAAANLDASSGGFAPDLFSQREMDASGSG